MSLVSCATLPEVALMMDAVWQDNAVNKDYIANCEAAKFLNSNTTASFGGSLTGTKDRVVNIKWINICDSGVEDVTDDCDLSTGNEAAIGCKDYELTLEKQSKPFMIDENDLRTKIFELPEIMAKALLVQAKELDEWWASQSVAHIETFLGENVYTAAPGTVSGTSTTIPAALFNLNIMAYLKGVVAKNKFSNPQLLGGMGSLYFDYINAGWNAGNAEGKGASARTSVFPTMFDEWNIDNKLYMIDKGSTAFYSKTRYPNNTEAKPYIPGTGKHGLRWSINSRNLPGVKYDVIYDTVCNNSGIFHVFKLRTLGGIFQSPTGCSSTNTGLLSFECA